MARGAFGNERRPLEDNPQARLMFEEKQEARGWKEGKAENGKKCGRRGSQGCAGPRTALGGQSPDVGEAGSENVGPTFH